MEDKKIMVDGVDVNSLYSEQIACMNRYEVANLFIKTVEKLASKEQECEKFRKANDEKNELLAQLGYPTVGTARRLTISLTELLEAYKMEAEEGIEINAELKAELEQYKDLAEHNGRVCNERLDKIDKLEHDINELKAENEELKKVSCKFKDYCTCDTEKFIQTLTEIKEIAENVQSFVGRIDIEDDVCEQMEQILQKIKECEVE